MVGLFAPMVGLTERCTLGCSMFVAREWPVQPPVLAIGYCNPTFVVYHPSFSHLQYSRSGAFLRIFSSVRYTLVDSPYD
jgi:hypothetical protein